MSESGRLLTWIFPVGLLAVLCAIGFKFGVLIKQRFFELLWPIAATDYKTALKNLEKGDLCSMTYHQSYDRTLKSRGLVRILEIEARSGGCHLTVFERNAFFEPLFYKSKEKFPGNKMEEFVNDLKAVKDCYIDVVVSTLILSSVKNVESTLSEIQRVMVPGGKFYYWENINDVPSSWLSFVKNMYTKVRQWLFHSQWDPEIDSIIELSPGFSVVKQKRFNIPVQKGILKMVNVHVMGVAIK